MGERTLESQTPIRNEKNKHQQLVCYVPDHMADHPCYFSTLTFFLETIQLLNTFKINFNFEILHSPLVRDTDKVKHVLKATK